MNKSISALPINNQRGATLIIALIMLLLLTIIGLSSMRGTSLQESMAGNMRDSSLALQAAEAALRQGEGVVDGKSFDELRDIVALNGTYTSFPGVAAVPTYRITKLAEMRPSLDPQDPIVGVVMRVEADASGMAQNSNGSAASKIKLRSVVLIK